MQRQLVQKQKVLQIMINENEQEKQKRQAEKANADEPSNIKQQKQEVRESKQSTSNFQINTTRLIITGVYLLFFYGGPIFILPNTLPLNKNLYKSFVNENQIGSLMYSLLGGSLDFRGSSMYFFTFREIFIFSIVVSYKIIDALRPINM
ncbi:UNKNOWN [Stylonychia lemnae]|uniref:Transmembrane protein n=1 Tax=Stylonychia lemnae TaxID=5949 RepID=A0A078AG40_STYLE|nr:UNKNOWN [Stylonychia lemnae]|eukprot:CDW80427.1 UNKNOWN [Stylonychia lemnae]